MDVSRQAEHFIACYTVLTRPNKVETAVHGCNCWLSVWTLSCRCPVKLFTQYQPCIIVCYSVYFWLIRSFTDPAFTGSIFVCGPLHHFNCPNRSSWQVDYLVSGCSNPTHFRWTLPLFFLTTSHPSTQISANAC